LREVSEKVWIAVSHDRNIRYDVEARRSIMEHGGRVFLLRGKARHSEIAEMFLRGMPGVDRLLKRQQPPFIAVVRRSPVRGILKVQVRVVLTPREWRSRGKR
jgi:hypothetical protein